MALTLQQASMIVDKALEKGRAMSLKPMTIAVLDAGGHLVAFKREDNSPLLRPDIAVGKAWGSLGLGYGSREIAERAQKNPSFVAALNGLAQGRVVPAAGGVLIRAMDGELIGAVGVTGDTGDNDEACALAGIAAAGLKAQPGAAQG